MNTNPDPTCDGVVPTAFLDAMGKTPDVVPLPNIPAPTQEPKTRLGTDWKAEFRPEELAEKGNAGKCVRLRGLQRCANMCGLVESYPEMNYIQRDNKSGIVQCVYHVRFNDGTHFAGAADVNDLNISDQFRAYPTSVAESRAEARALRKALNITDMLAAEEVDSSESPVNPNGKAEKQQVAAILMLAEQVGKPILDVFTEVLGSDRSKKIYAVDDISSDEAIKLLGWLNQKRSEMPSAPAVTPTKKIELNKKKE